MIPNKTSHPKYYWDILIGLLIPLSLCHTTILIAFSLKYLDGQRLLEEIVDCFFMMDIILTFFTAFEKDVDMVRNPLLIGIQYLKTWLIFDLLATVPGLVTY